MKYNEATSRYFESTPRAGRLSGGDVRTGGAGARARGLWVEFDVRSSSGRIDEAAFRALGCPHTLAAASWVAEQAAGRDAGWRPSLEELARVFEVPAEKRGRLLVVEDAWLAARAGAAGAS